MNLHFLVNMYEAKYEENYVTKCNEGVIIDKYEPDCSKRPKQMVIYLDGMTIFSVA